MLDEALLLLLDEDEELDDAELVTLLDELLTLLALKLLWLDADMVTVERLDTDDRLDELLLCVLTSVDEDEDRVLCEDELSSS